MVVLRAVAFVVGVIIVSAVLRSAVLTVVVPRGEQTVIARRTFLGVRAVYGFLAKHERSDERRERTLARFGPVSLITLAVVWAMLTLAGFVLLFWSAGVHDVFQSVSLSGSSITTLGVTDPSNWEELLLSFAEAFLGLGLVALLISYLPTLYTLFARREAEVVKLEVRAGSPPTALEMLLRFHRIRWIDHLEDTFAEWEEWFGQLEESHTSYPALVYFRSQHPSNSWITGAGAVLDSMAFSVSALDVPDSPPTGIALRSGYLALRAIAGYYAVPFDPDPAPNASISIYREEFDLLYVELQREGVALKADRERAWRDFAGWRVNYDEPLLALCALCAAPATPWSSDRSYRFHPPTFFRPRWRVDASETPPSW